MDPKVAEALNQKVSIAEMLELVKNSTEIATAFSQFRAQMVEKFEMPSNHQLNGTILGFIFGEAGATQEECQAVCMRYVELATAQKAQENESPL